MTSRVAFQGEPGAFSEEAARSFLGDDVETVPCRDFAGVGRRVAAGEAEWGVLPIENTLAGAVAGSHDVLAAGGLRVVGEVVLPIHHCVLGVPGATEAGLARIESHPVALAQCTRYLAARADVEAAAVYDTAGAAMEVAARGDPAVAAIAGRAAARRYGLVVLAADVEDRADNRTRFLVVARAGGVAAPGAGDRTLLVAEPRQGAGALAGILYAFVARGLHVARVEARPAGEPWRYRFFVEVDGAAAEALAELGGRVAVLGSYPRWK